MKMYIVYEYVIGYYDETDKNIIKAICTSPEEVKSLKFSAYDLDVIKIITFEEKDLNKKIHLTLDNFSSSPVEDFKIETYKDFLKSNNLEVKKVKNKKSI